MKYYKAGELEKALKYAEYDEQTELREETKLWSLKPPSTASSIKVSSSSAHNRSSEHSLARSTYLLRNRARGSLSSLQPTATPSKNVHNALLNPPPSKQSNSITTAAPETPKKLANASGVSCPEHATISLTNAVTDLANMVIFKVKS